MSKQTGQRFNKGKAKLSYNFLGPEAQQGEAEVWEAGAVKYSRGNWLKGMQYTTTIDSLTRHIMKFPIFWTQDRDLRTLVQLDPTGVKPKRAMDGVAHNALDDAKHQVKYACSIYKRIKGDKEY